MKTAAAINLLTPKKQALLALSAYLVVSLAATWPMMLHPGDRIVGGDKTDLYAHLWGYWRTERALLVNHELPFQEDQVHYPYGGVLYHVDLLNSLVMIPLKALAGFLAGYNLLVLAQLAGGALAMFLLARMLIGGFAPAFLAGLIFAFSPYMLAFPLASGVSERLNIAWIPLFFLFFLKQLEHPRLKYLLSAVLVFFLALIGCWKYGLFIFLNALLLTVYLLLGYFVRGAAMGGLTIGLVKDKMILLLFRKLLPLALGCGLAALPVYLMARESIVNPASQTDHAVGLFWRGDRPLLGDTEGFGKNLFHAVDFFRPGRSNLRVNESFDLMYKSIYLGYAVLALALLSLAARKKFAPFFLPVAVLFMLLTLGPNLQLTMGGTTYRSLIYHGLARVIPLFYTMETPWEFSLLVYFFLALAAGFGLDWLLGKAPERFGGLIAAGLLILTPLETLVLSPVPVPVPTAEIRVPAWYQTLAQDHEDFAIFDFPPLRPKSRYIPEEYFYYQTIHGKKIPYPVGTPNLREAYKRSTAEPGDLRHFQVGTGWMDLDPFWRKIELYLLGRNPRLVIDPVRAEEAKLFLQQNNFRYFIMHNRLLTSDQLTIFVDLFRDLFGEPIFEDRDLIVFPIGKM